MATPDPQASLQDSADRIKVVVDGLADWWEGGPDHQTNNGHVDLPSPAKLVNDFVVAAGVQIGAAQSAAVAAAQSKTDAQLLVELAINGKVVTGYNTGATTATGVLAAAANLSYVLVQTDETRSSTPYPQTIYQKVSGAWLFIREISVTLPANLKMQPLRRLARQAQRLPIYASTPNRLRVLLIGDSLAPCAQYLVSQLIAQFGFAGWFSPVAVQTIIAAPYTYGAATIVSDASSYFGVTPTSDYGVLSAANQAHGNGINVNGNSSPYAISGDGSLVNARKLNRQTPLCNLLKVAFGGATGGGVFRMEYSLDYGVNWVAAASMSAIDTSTYANGSLQILTGAIPESAVTAVRAWRVSGTSTVYAVGAESTTRAGVVANCFHKGSIAVGSTGVAGANGTAALFQSCAPDLVTCCALDGIVLQPLASDGIVPAMQALNLIFDALPVKPDVIWWGIPNTSGDSAAATSIYNGAMRAYAQYKGQGFVDTFAALGMQADMNAAGWSADGTHPSPAGWFVAHQEAMQQFGLDQWAFGQGWLPRRDNARNLWPGNMGNWPAGTTFACTPGTVTQIIPGLAITVSGAYVGPAVAVNRVTLDQKTDPSCNRYAISVVAAGSAGGFSLDFQCGPARFGAGRQVCLAFRAKTSAATGFAMFSGRFAGAGVDSGDAANQSATLSTWFRDYSYVVNLPALINDEAAGTTFHFVLANMPSTSDITITDIQVTHGPISDAVSAPVLMDTFSIDFPSIAAATQSAGVACTLLGVRKGEPVRVLDPIGLPAGIILKATVTASDTVMVYAVNITAAAIDIPALNYVLMAG